MKPLIFIAKIAVLSTILLGCRQASTPVIPYTVVNTYPHDPKAFTQGLVYDSDHLYESTGLYGRSSLRQVKLTSGNFLRINKLDPKFFGEGMTIFSNRIYQLTWKEETCFICNRSTLEPLATFSYHTEGWGLTHDDQHLIMSDGTATLRWRSPENFAETRQITVRDSKGPVSNLNALAYIKGKIWANVWPTTKIAIISPTTGKVQAWLDLSQLQPPASQAADVANGIAYDEQTGRIFLTGKLWPKIYEIRLCDR